MPPTHATRRSRGAHYLTRLLLAQGHDARLMPPAYVKPNVKSQKNATTATPRRSLRP
jgi:transposase